MSNAPARECGTKQAENNHQLHYAAPSLCCLFLSLKCMNITVLSKVLHIGNRILIKSVVCRSMPLSSCMDYLRQCLIVNISNISVE